MFANNVSDPSGWSLGKMNNLREVFGNNFSLNYKKIKCLIYIIQGTSAWMWLIPVKSFLGDGISYPSRNYGLEIPDYKINGNEMEILMAHYYYLLSFFCYYCRSFKVFTTTQGCQIFITFKKLLVAF